LTVRLLTAWPLHQPGYTDAYYYAVGARQLYAGEGFSEPFIWNYLDPPASLPHPGYLYWMPLTAIVGWLGLEALGDSFFANQLPFVLLSALLPLVAYGVAWDLSHERKHAALAGLLALFPGFYAHVSVLPDTFTPFALAGSVCLWATGRGLREQRMAWFVLAGIASGLGHLARADGVLLVGIAVLAALGGRLPADQRQLEGGKPALRIAARIALSFAGYLIVMGPWFIRNWQVAGAALPGAGTQALFLTTYDDMFAYERSLTLETYFAWGWDAILRSKGQALLLNLQRLWVENLLIFLLPFTVLGWWQLRKKRLLWPFFLYLPLLFLVMTLVFTFPGMRGGLYHSGGALLPFVFAASGPGLEVAVHWAARWRPHWRVKRAWSVFASGLLGLAILLTCAVLWRAGVLSGMWNERQQGYAEIGDWLANQGAREVVVMVGDAPGFTWHTGHLSIAVPNEPPDTILSVADRYDARYLVLDGTRPRTTDAIYAGETAHPRLRYRYPQDREAAEWQLYEIIPY
jgi:hypothetical protein